MAIKINSVTVIDDDRSGKFRVLNPGIIEDGALEAPLDVGDVAYSRTNKRLMIWTGSTFE